MLIVTFKILICDIIKLKILNKYNFMKKYDYENRISKDIKIDEIQYARCLLDVIEFLSIELTEFLKKEGRFFGLAKSYMNSIKDSYSKLNKNILEEDMEMFDRVLYLFKPLIISEFNRLKQKRLSEGDSTICIMKRILEIISEIQDNPNIKELNTVKKIIEKFYNNIKNKSKLDPLYYLSNFTRLNINNGNVGKYRSDVLNLNNSNLPKEKFIGDNVKLQEDSNNKISEISWTEEK